LYLTNGGEDVNLIYLLVKHDLPLSLAADEDDSSLPINGQSWVYLVTAANKTGSDILVTALDWIVREIYQEIGPKGVYQLAYALNEQQDILLETCSVHIQQFFHQYLLLCDRYFILTNEPTYQSPHSVIMTAYDYLASNFYRKCYLFCTQETTTATHEVRPETGTEVDGDDDVSSLGESCAQSSVNYGGDDEKYSSPTPLPPPDFYRADSFQSSHDHDPDLIRKGGMTSSEFFDFAQLVGLEYYLHGKNDEIAMFHFYSKLLEASHGNLTEEFLVNYCEEYFHHPRKIKLKFSIPSSSSSSSSSTSSFQQTQQYEYLLHEKELLGSRSILKLLDTPSSDILRQGLRSYYHPRYDLTRYQSLITMTNYDTTLDLIYRNEQPNPQQVQRIMKQIASAILDCHERGVIHGNLTMKNIIRVSSSSSSSSSRSSSFLLSNFYYFEQCSICNSDEGPPPATGGGDPTGPTAVSSEGGRIPITGYLPPECFVKRNHNQKTSPGNSLRISADSSFEKTQHRFSWISDEDSLRDLPPASSPSFLCHLHKYLDHEEITTAPTGGGSKSSLPSSGHLNYGLDSWAFGLILFAFLTGDHFLPLDRDENFHHAKTVIPYYVALTAEEIQSKIKSKVTNLLASNLLFQILQPNQETRITSFHHILTHPYFQSSHTTATGAATEGAGVSTLQESKQELLLSSKSLLPQQQQVEEHSKVVTSKSTANPNPSSTDRYNSTKFQPRRYKGVQSFPSDVLSFINILTTHALRKQRGGTKGTYHPTSFLIINRKLTFLKSISLDSNLPTGTSSGIPDIPPLVTSRVQRWINKLYNYFVLIDHYDPSSPSLTKSSMNLDHEILLAMNEICNENELYLYLVDEVTLEPILSTSMRDGEEETSMPATAAAESMSFPIMITHPSAIIPMILPLMRETYKMICSGKFVENMGHCFGYPLDLIPVHWIDAVEHITGSFESQQREDEITNWNQYMHLKSAPPSPAAATTESDASSSSLSMAVNHLTQFLDLSDPYQLWCGMTKIYLTEDLHCWTQENIQHLLSSSSSVTTAAPDAAAVVTGDNGPTAGESTNEQPSDTCSEESDLKHMNGILFPPVVSLLLTD
jgi:hypothetical protein